MKMNMGITLQLLAPYTGQKFIQDLSWLVVILVSIAGALSTLYAVYIAYLFFTASDPTKRKAAKDRFIKVISSSIIIVALAGILGALDVTFVEQKGNYTGPVAGDGGVVYANNYAYDGSAEMMLTGNQYNGKITATGSFTIYTIYIKGDGAQVDKYGDKVKIKSCSVVTPTDWPGANLALTELSVNADTFMDTTGAEINGAEIKFSITTKSNMYAAQIPVVKSDKGNIITVAVECVYIQNQMQSFTVYIPVYLSSNGTSLVQFYHSA